MYMYDDADKQNFDALVNYKEQAEEAIGVKLDWRRLEGKKASSIDIYKKCDINNPAKREEIFSWYKEYTEKFITFFKPIIKKL